MTSIYRGYMLPAAAIASLEVELSKELIHPLHSQKEDTDYIFGYKVFSVPNGEAKSVNPYTFETCDWCHKDREIMNLALKYFKNYLDKCFPETFCANIV